MSLNLNDFYEFDAFRVDVRKRALLRGGEPVAIAPKAFDTLLVLLERSGEDVSKRELMEAVWPETFVEENNLSQAVSAVRRALGEGRSEHRFVVTLPGRGYRFVAEVKSFTQSREEALGVSAPLRGVRSRLTGLMLASSGLVFVLASLMVVFWAERRSSTPDSPLPAVAVLPFRTVGEPGAEYLGPGITDSLIANIGKTGQVAMRPTVAVLKYDRPGQDPLAAGRELGVEAVLDGTIQRSGGRVTVTVQLLRVRDGAALWAGSFDEDSTHILAVQDRISAEVASALLLKLDDAGRQQLVRRYTDDTVAYDAYLRGRFFWNKRTDEGYQKAIGFFDQAILHDPEYALAYAGIADSWVLLGLGQVDADSRFESLGKAKHAALRAIALDPSLAEAHTSLGAVREVFDKDQAEAEREYRLAIALNPNYATAHQWYGELLEAEGRYDEATASLRRALEIDPLSLVVNVALGENLFYQRRYDESVAQLQRTLELDPAFVRARFDLGLALEQKRAFDGAIAEFQRIRDTDAGNSRAIAALAHVYASAGRRDETRRMLAEFERRARTEQVEPYDRVILYVGLGDYDRAVEWLAKARERHDGNLLWLSSDPRLDGLRADARWRAVFAS